MPEDALMATTSIREEQEVAPHQVAARYKILATQRETKLERARQMAALTIPSIFPPQEATEQTHLPAPYQSLGARAVNNLSNKLLLTLFPVNTPFFKMEVSEGVIQELEDNDAAKDAKTQIEREMSKLENIIQSDMEVSAFRVRFFEAIRSMIVVGDHLLYIPPEGSPASYKLNQYVVKRSVRGLPLEIILCEVISKAELEPRWLEQIMAAQTEQPVEATKEAPTNRGYNMYTRIYLKDGTYHEAKYIEGVMLEGTEATYPENASAWIPLRWNGLSGEDYGRSYVEEYLGDLIALDGLSRAIQEHSAIAAKTFGLIRPNSVMSTQDLANVRNGGFVVGDPEDLTFPEVGKQRDMAVAQQMLANIEDSLSRAFLITQVRDSERTTAEEVRLLATELETGLGGAYSLLANTFQKPILMRELFRLEKLGLLKIPSAENFEPKIIVGLEGLGRGTDLEKFMKVIRAYTEVAPILEQIPDIDPKKLHLFLFNSVGLDPDTLMKDEQTKEAEAQATQQAQQQEQQAEMMQNVVKQATPALAQGAVDNPEAAQQALSQIQQQQQQG